MFTFTYEVEWENMVTSSCSIFMRSFSMLHAKVESKQVIALTPTVADCSVERNRLIWHIKGNKCIMVLVLHKKRPDVWTGVWTLSRENQITHDMMEQQRSFVTTVAKNRCNSENYTFYFMPSLESQIPNTPYMDTIIRVSAKLYTITYNVIYKMCGWFFCFSWRKIQPSGNVSHSHVLWLWFSGWQRCWRSHDSFLRSVLGFFFFLLLCIIAGGLEMGGAQAPICLTIDPCLPPSFLNPAFLRSVWLYLWRNILRLKWSSLHVLPKLSLFTDTWTLD